MDQKHKALIARNTSGGGLTPHSLGTWDVLFDAQATRGVSGSFLEIGVWTGIGLSAMGMRAAPDEKIAGIDLYIQRDKVRDNYEALTGRSFETLRFFERSSLAVRKAGTLQAEHGSFRWIHIDGEHSFDAVCNDLEFAMDLMKDEGIVVVDDFFNLGSAGITEAVYFMLGRHPHRLRMFLAGMNKAYLASPRHFGFYRSYCINHLSDRLEADFDAPITIGRNGHSTEIDYLSFFERIGNYTAMEIGKLHETVPFGFM
ncbi:MAG TPA: class I SAM-dependent methyltransferase [Beijerinckiaceae bacterium]|jgi:predicted O-methyltransferase YrrM